MPFTEGITAKKATPVDAERIMADQDIEVDNIELRRFAIDKEKLIAYGGAFLEIDNPDLATKKAYNFLELFSQEIFNKVRIFIENAEKL